MQDYVTPTEEIIKELVDRVVEDGVEGKFDTDYVTEFGVSISEDTKDNIRSILSAIADDNTVADDEALFEELKGQLEKDNEDQILKEYQDEEERLTAEEEKPVSEGQGSTKVSPSESSSRRQGSTRASPSGGQGSTRASPSESSPSGGQGSTRAPPAARTPVKAPVPSKPRPQVIPTSRSVEKSERSENPNISELSLKVEAYYRVIARLVYLSTTISPSSFINSLKVMRSLNSDIFSTPIDIALNLLKPFSDKEEVNVLFRKYLIRAAYLVLRDLKNIPGSEYYGARELYIIRNDPARFKKIRVDSSGKPLKEVEVSTVVKSVPAVLFSTASPPQKQLLDNGIFISEDDFERAKKVYTIPFRLPNRHYVKKYTDLVDELDKRNKLLSEVTKKLGTDEGIAYVIDGKIVPVVPSFFQVGQRVIVTVPEIIIDKGTVADAKVARKRILDNISETFEASRKANTNPSVTFDGTKRTGSSGVDRPTIFLSPVVDWVQSGTDRKVQDAIATVKAANKGSDVRKILDVLRKFSQGTEAQKKKATTAIELGIGKTRSVNNLISYSLSANKNYTIDPKKFTYKYTIDGSSLNTLLNARVRLGYDDKGEKREEMDTSESVLNLVNGKILKKSDNARVLGKELSVQSTKKVEFNTKAFNITDLSSINGVVTINHATAVDFPNAIKNSGIISRDFKYIVNKNLKEGGTVIDTDDEDVGLGVGDGITAGRVREFIQNEATALSKLSSEETKRRNAEKKANESAAARGRY